MSTRTGTTAIACVVFTDPLYRRYYNDVSVTPCFAASSRCVIPRARNSRTTSCQKSRRLVFTIARDSIRPSPEPSRAPIGHGYLPMSAVRLPLPPRFAKQASWGSDLWLAMQARPRDGHGGEDVGNLSVIRSR